MVKEKDSAIKIIFIVGTRPEAIKMAPVILKFQEHRNIFNIVVCVTGQHEELVNQVNELFDIKEDRNLKLMSDNQTLAGFGAKCLSQLDLYIGQEKPDWIFVHGDTSSAFYGALAGYYNKVKIAHVEAGLRTFNKNSPFPEEINRTLIGKLADLHFAPTTKSFNNLIAENVNPSKVVVTGNTVIDALKLIVKKIDSKRVRLNEITKFIRDSDEKVILITMHRRENFGDSINNICRAIKELAINYPKCKFVYPVHPNPNVLKPVHELLSGIDNVYLIEPLNYVDFVYMMKKAYVIFSDSGGVQEEAPSLGIPVIVLRDKTERVEAVDAGTVVICGTKTKDIINHFDEIMNNQELYDRMSKAINPYGDGTASQQIVSYFLRTNENINF